MAIILTNQKLTQLLLTLQNVERAYQIRGEILSKLHSVITDYDFIVDRWPDFRALVVRADRATAKYPVFLGNHTYVYATDRDALELLLQQPGIIHWSEKTAFSLIKYLQEMGLIPKAIHEDMSTTLGKDAPPNATVAELKHGRKGLEDDPRPGMLVSPKTPEMIQRIQYMAMADRRMKTTFHYQRDGDAKEGFGDDVVSTVINMICQRDRTYSVDSFIVMKATKETLRLRNIPEGYTMSNLHPEEAHLVNTRWYYNKGTHSEIYLKEILSKLPSCGLYNDEGSLVGCALTCHHGNLGLLHVVKEHRGKGYAKVIMSHLASLCLQQMDEVHVHIHRDNAASICVHKNIGFHCVSKLGPHWWIESQI